ncbi:MULTISPECIES: cyclase family protein [unclassified Campylobacter]|uniref:cyclase family protein n=1 Tax=unclassified Campylobacter TaxID=2593542 RepID=UPI003D341468
MIKFLSYAINENTPTYGNKDKFNISKTTCISEGAVANNSFISTTTHIGTHIDMPYHFYENGQSICDFDDSFWIFKNVVIVCINPLSLVIEKELMHSLENFDSDCDFLIVKTGSCLFRDDSKYTEVNYGFSPNLYDFLLSKMPNLKVFGFDTISVSSFKHREIGRDAHRRFLNPDRPILLLEDMDLNSVDENTKFSQVVIAPLRIQNCDGLPCSVIGFIDD